MLCDRRFLHRSKKDIELQSLKSYCSVYASIIYDFNDQKDKTSAYIFAMETLFTVLKFHDIKIWSSIIITFFLKKTLLINL